MSDETPSVTKDVKPVTALADNPDAGLKQEASHPGESYHGPSSAQQRPYRKNDRPYGFANATIGLVAAFISAALVGVLIF